MEFNEIVQNFPTTPFLFIGSGFSRRYYNLPDWKGLLQVFAQRLNPDDEFALRKYFNNAEKLKPYASEGDKLASVASIIRRDFNDAWFNRPDIRNVDETYMNFIKNGQDPFKVEVSQYIKNNSKVVEGMEDELNLLKEASKNSITGIITTNYDTLLEEQTEYECFVGQEELVFSPLQNMAEIYKIHGSISNPNSIILTEEDYNDFRDTCPYLTAKLMTIFMEYPIIFMGYSLNDSNIHLILTELTKCLSEKNLIKLQNRFIYIQYEKGQNDLHTFESSISIGGNLIHMTGIRTDNFKSIYQILSSKRASLNIKTLRRLKESLYEYVISNKPSNKVIVKSIDDTNINPSDIVLGIGVPSDFGVYGIVGVDRKKWFEHVILNTLPYSADDLLQHYNDIRPKGSLPFNKLLSQANEKHKYCIENRFKNIDNIIPKSKKENRHNVYIKDRSINGIIKTAKSNNFEDKKLILDKMLYLEEREININDLEKFLKETYLDDDFMEQLYNNDVYKSHFFKLILIYDCLKYSKEVKEDWS